jgi:hypothetical protein
MASVLFTALALIAAGQAEVPSAPADGGKVQSVRAASAAATDPAPRSKSRYRR